MINQETICVKVSVLGIDTVFMHIFRIQSYWLQNGSVFLRKSALLMMFAKVVTDLEACVFANELGSSK